MLLYQTDYLTVVIVAPFTTAHPLPGAPVVP
jgi:hypothetical protein